jgi:hypothetical protein
LPEWLLGTIVELTPTDMHLFPGSPMFLGYLPQRFKVYQCDVASFYAKYLPKSEKALNNDLIAVLRRVNPALAPISGSQSELGQIKDFGAIAIAFQAQGNPMKDVKAGTPNQRTEVPWIPSSILRDLFRAFSSVGPLFMQAGNPQA